MAFGIGSKLKKLGRSIEKETKRAARTFEDETIRQASDVVKVGTLGIIDPKGIRRQQKAAEREQRRQKKILKKQERAAILEGAELDDSIARRSVIAQKGGRQSLLSGGQTGFQSSLLR